MNMNRKNIRRWEDGDEGSKLCSVAAAVIGAAVIGGAATTYAGNKAAKTQKDAAASSNATELQMYNQTREDQGPARAAGQTAIGQMSAGTAAGGEFNRPFTMADFQQDPSYQFRLNQGEGALQSSAAARGGLLNGGTLKAISDYGQNAASQEYASAYNRYASDQTNRFNRLASIAGMGQTAANTTDSIGTNVAGNIGQTQQSIGNVNAANYVNSANALNSGLSSLSNYYAQRQMQQAPTWYNTSGGTSNARGPTSDQVTLSDGSTFGV
jgi:hypothetical protein